MKKHVLLLLSFSLLASCVSSRVKDFTHVRIGMLKDQVLEIMGSPTKSEYINGNYIWTYKFYENDQILTKEVQIQNEAVVYVGDVLPEKAREAHRVSLGMSKSQVLDKLGFPEKTKKEGETELWTFVYSEGSGRFSQEISFEKDKVVALKPPEQQKE